MNDVLRIARLKIALQRAFLGRAILIFTMQPISNSPTSKDLLPYLRLGLPGLSASIASLN